MYGMPDIPSDTWYSNLNQCYNVTWTLTGGTLPGTTYVKCGLPVKAGEVLIWNNTGADVGIKTGRPMGLSAQSVDPPSTTEFILKDGDQMTFRGITDTDQVSAAGTNATTLYGRSQWYSMTPQTAR